MPNQEAYDYYTRTVAEDASAWSTKITADSLPAYLTYNAVAAAPQVAPTPLLLVHGTQDATLLPKPAQATYDAAQPPKRLEWIETDNHVQLYDQDPHVGRRSDRRLAGPPHQDGGRS